MIKPDFSELMQQAKHVQENIQKMQEELKNIEVIGESGAGLVKVTMSGGHEVKRVELEDALLSEEKSVIQDLVVTATNDAIKKVERAHKDRMSDMSGGMGLSSIMNMFK